MNCAMCDKEMESALPDTPEFKDNLYQPYAGCELRIVAAFGSTKLDLSPGCTHFRGVICDECALPLAKKMDVQAYGMDGESWPVSKEDLE